MLINILPFIAYFTLLISSCDATKNYILTPKKHENLLIKPAVFAEMAYVHDLKELVSFEHTDDHFVVFYETSHDNLIKNKKALENYFDIEEDKVMSINNVESNSVMNNFQMVYKDSSAIPWHLNRVSKRTLSDEDNFAYDKPGSCHKDNSTLIDTYIVDTGIDISHPEFENRAVWSANFADNVDTDCNSHGTHVAGLVGSKSYGVCVDAKLHAVKVLSCDGSGSLSGVIRGIEWVFNEHKRKSRNESRRVKSVINMSLGGGFSSAINKAVETVANNDENFYVVVAAGNENNDACNTSPASAPSVLTVMASDEYDNKAWFSNWGRCADIYSPGVDVLSTIPNGKTAKYSGTSMASPVMVGVLNHYLDMYPKMNMKDIKKLVKKKATKNAIRGNKNGSNNLLAYFEH